MRLARRWSWECLRTRRRRIAEERLKKQADAPPARMNGGAALDDTTRADLARRRSAV
jgi:hypothetical protein